MSRRWGPARRCFCSVSGHPATFRWPISTPSRPVCATNVPLPARCWSAGDLVRAPQLVAVRHGAGLRSRPAGPVLRSGARAGDVVGVVGRLGWAAAGLRLLLAGETRRPPGRRSPSSAARPTPLVSRWPKRAPRPCVTSATAWSGDARPPRPGVRRRRSTSSLLRSGARGAAGVTDDELLSGGEDHALAFTVTGRCGAARRGRGHRPRAGGRASEFWSTGTPRRPPVYRHF